MSAVPPRAAQGRVHTGTVWQQACAGFRGGLHTYRKRVVSVDVANDLERELERLRAAADEALDAVDVYAAGDLDHELHQLVEHHRGLIGGADV